MSKEKKSLLSAIAATAKVINVAQELAVEERLDRSETDQEETVEPNQSDEQPPNE